MAKFAHAIFHPRPPPRPLRTRALSWLARRLSPDTRKSSDTAVPADRWWLISTLVSAGIAIGAYFLLPGIVRDQLSTAQAIAATVLVFTISFVILIVRNPKYVIRRALVSAAMIGLILAGSSGIQIVLARSDGTKAALTYGISWPSLVLIGLIVVVLLIAHWIHATRGAS